MGYFLVTNGEKNILRSNAIKFIRSNLIDIDLKIKYLLKGKSLISSVSAFT